MIIRRKESVIPTIISILKKQIIGFKKIQLAAMHADALEQAKALQQALHEIYPSVEIPISEFTPVMVAHAGPGLVGLGYFFE